MARRLRGSAGSRWSGNEIGDESANWWLDAIESSRVVVISSDTDNYGGRLKDGIEINVRQSGTLFRSAFADGVEQRNTIDEPSADTPVGKG